LTPSTQVHQSRGAGSHAATPPTVQSQSAAVTGAEWRKKGLLFILLCVHRRAGMPEKKRNGGDTQPDADNYVIDGESQSAHSAALHTPDAGIWTSEALSAPTSRHLSGEAWPREVRAERNRTCRGASCG
jgi:hypothetical protein